MVMLLFKALFVGYSLVSSLFLMYWCTFGAFKQWRKYEEELVLVTAWRRHFKENVSHSWVFYDGIGG